VITLGTVCAPVKCRFAAICEHTVAICEHTAAICEHTAAICEHTVAICEHTAAICEHTAAICEQTVAICEHTVAICEHTVAICEHTAAPVSRGQCLRNAVRNTSSDTQTVAVIWQFSGDYTHSDSKWTTGAQYTLPLQNNLIIPSSTFVSIFSTPELNRTLSCLLCEP
jgi:hypothetical protein